MINKKINYTINQKWAAIFYFACFSAPFYSNFSRSSPYLPKSQQEKKNDSFEKKKASVYFVQHLFLSAPFHPSQHAMVTDNNNV